MSKRVAVIGAGVSGLVTVKELLEHGHQPLCFERAKGPGGVFRFDEREGVIWESCRLTSSGLLTAFSDFPVAPQQARHMHAAEYVDYLESYCREFGIRDRVRFARTVLSVRRLENGAWRLESRGASGKRCEDFDAVAVCSGLHQHPHLPAYPGQDTFSGESIHASDYRRPEPLTGKRVLLVGAGESGADIAAEVAGHAAETVLALRRGVAVVSRDAFGKPRDYLTSRLMNGAAHWVFQTRNPADDGLRSVYRLAGLPVVVIDKLLQVLYRQLWENLPMFISTRWSVIRSRLRARKLTLQLLSESGGTVNEQFGTKDDEFVRCLARGTLRRVSGIRRFDGAVVHFEDGSSFEPDLVIFCTGFETRAPFLEDGLASRDRYLNTFDPDLGPTLAFIGFLRPAFGAIPPLAELQARWFAQLLGGAAEFPSTDEMRESIAWWNEHRRHIFRAKDDRLSHLVDFTTFCDRLAEQVGCKPSAKDLESESRAFRRRYVSGPFAAAQYRLVGPGAKPDLARATIESLPVAHPWPDRANLRMRWWLCRRLERILGPEYAPKLRN